MRKPSWEMIQQDAKRIPAKYRARDWSAFRTYWRANERFFDHYVATNVRATVQGTGEKLPLSPEMQREWSAKIMHEFVFGTFDSLGGRVYKIAAEFGAELARTNLDLPVKHAPRSPELVCIEFPEGVTFSVPTDTGMCEVSSVYLFTIDGADAEPGALVTYHLFLPLLGANGIGPAGEFAVQHYWESVGALATTIHESFARGEDESTGAMADPLMATAFSNVAHSILIYALKCLLYIHSGQPDLRQYRPPPRPLTGNPKKLRRWEKDNADKAMIPMTFVGYDWKKPRVFGVDSTTVTGHFRWQPYGPGRELVKLIWIDQHERHFKEPEVRSTP